MNPQTEAQILAAYGRPGWRVVARRPELGKGENDVGDPISNAPTGNEIWDIQGPGGQPDTVVVHPEPAGRVESGGQWTTEPLFSPVKGPEKQIATGGTGTEANSPELAAQRKSETEHTQAVTAGLQDENAQRDRNAANGFGRLTDKELADKGIQTSQQGLSQQQLDLAKAKQASDQTQQGVTNDQTQQRINIEAQNSAIADANSQIARINAETAAKRAALEADLQAKQADHIITQDELDKAKFAYQKIKDDADRQIVEQQARIQSASQQEVSRHNQAQEQYQQGSLGVQQQQANNQTVQLQETQRANQANEAYRNAEQARGAAGDILQANQNAGQTGAGLLNQRVQSGTSLLNSLTGLAGSGKIFNVPAGLGAGLVSGVQDFVTGLGGGQGVYDTAAQAVKNLVPGGTNNPMAAQATAVLGQMLERYQQQTGQPHPVAQALAQQQPQQAPQQFTSPPPAAPPGPVGASVPTPVGTQSPVINFNFTSPPVQGRYSGEPQLPMSMQGVMG